MTSGKHIINGIIDGLRTFQVCSRGFKGILEMFKRIRGVAGLHQGRSRVLQWVSEAFQGVTRVLQGVSGF